MAVDDFFPADQSGILHHEVSFDVGIGQCRVGDVICVLLCIPADLDCAGLVGNV